MKRYIQYMFVISISLAACEKSNFLAKKPKAEIVIANTLKDYQAILENPVIFGLTGGLAQLSADEYMVSDANWLSVNTPIQRNAYVWLADIYEGGTGLKDWNNLYQQVFYSNCVIDGLANYQGNQKDLAGYLKGWALFNRAYAFYDLTRNFCKAYDKATSETDLGIPLKLTANIEDVQPRATLAASYHQIFKDLEEALVLLPSERPNSNLNRPSKLAVHALLARIYLDRREYEKAEQHSSSILALYNKLIDYNEIDLIGATPFSSANDELIYNVTQHANYFEFTGCSATARGKISPEILDSYQPNDLRKTSYFIPNADGTYTKKRGYNGTGGYPFTGLAVDEIYLIKAECLARKGETQPAVQLLNELLIKRFDKRYPFNPLTAKTPNEALQLIFKERQKELIWRGLRWHDLKRLNKEGANITLVRIVNGTQYLLPPNDPRYIFPIPDEEIALSGIIQNFR